jgi:hypothetical protein
MIVDLGRFRQGDVVEIVLSPAVLPGAAPELTVTQGEATIEVVDGWTWDGVTFRALLLLGVQYPAGGTFLVSATIAGEVFEQQFEVVPGGDPGSDIVALYEHEGASQRVVLAQLRSGDIVSGTDPYVE